MTEPTSAAAGAYACAVTALPLAIFGAATDALVLGLFAALLVSILMPTISTRIRAFSAVLLSGVAAGYCAPVLASVAASQVTALAGSGDTLRMPIALLIGVAAPTAIPVALTAFSAWIGKQGGAA